jgi:hypothetical protein
MCDPPSNDAGTQDEIANSCGRLTLDQNSGKAFDDRAARHQHIMRKGITHSCCWKHILSPIA